MRRFFMVFVLLLPLLAYGQVVTTSSGLATTGGPAVPSAPVSPPQMVPANVALPGSGTPTGVPPNLSINNAATGEYVTVYQPGVSVNGVPVTLGPGQQQAQAAANASTAQTRFSLGIGNFVGSAAGGTAPAKGASLAEVASSLGSKPLIQNRKLTNNDVAAMENQSQSSNGRKVITNADLQALTSGTGNTPIGTQSMQQNPVVASEQPLDRNDLNQVNNALARSQAGQQSGQTEVAQNRADEYSRVVQEAESGEQQNPQTQNQQARPTEPTTPPANAEQANQAPANREQLPASGSPLPMLALVGLIAIGTGMVYRWKTR